MALSGSEFGTATNRAGQKTISVTISFLCHRVIALIKAQVCDNYIYAGPGVFWNTLYSIQNFQVRLWHFIKQNGLKFTK